MLRKYPPVDPVLSCLFCFRKPSVGVCQVVSNSPDPGIAWPSARFPPDLWRWFEDNTASIRRLIHSRYVAKQREATGLDNRGKWRLLSGVTDIFIPHEVRPFEAKNSSQAPLVQRVNSKYVCFVVRIGMLDSQQSRMVRIVKMQTILVWTEYQDRFGFHEPLDLLWPINSLCCWCRINLMQSETLSPPDCSVSIEYKTLRLNYSHGATSDPCDRRTTNWTNYQQTKIPLFSGSRLTGVRLETLDEYHRPIVCLGRTDGGGATA